jgi:branched-chain amino acid transport system ATP-binding protein
MQLEAKHISVAYGAHRALDDVSVRVERGEICVILGANGAGKTTLLKAIAGLVPAPGASVTIDDEELHGKAPNRIVEHGIALVPEGRGIFGELTVAENLTLGAYGVQAREGSEKRLRQVLELFPRLGERRTQVVRTMSGGEQQMVAVGRALMSNPAILMLDEPSLGLSPLLSTEVFKSLKAVQDTGVGILLVEQNARQSLAIADRAYLLENGRIAGEGRAEDMLHDPAVQKAYLGGAASDAHRRFGDEAVPLAVAPSGHTAADLAARAAEIARAHVSRTRVNGHAAPLVRAFTKTEAIIVPSQAHDLSRKAADMVRRATEISAAYVKEKREAVAQALTVHPVKGKKAKGGKKEKKAKKK